MEKNMISKQFILDKAFGIFRDWTQKIQREYPNLDLTIKDETCLTENLLETIQNAQIALMKDEKAESRKIEGYNIRYMLGFMESNLNTKWYHEYFIKRSNEYKEFIAIKAIKLYFEVDDLVKIKISSIYKQLLINDINLENIQTDIHHHKLERNELADHDSIYPNELLQMLNNKTNYYINEYLSKNIPNYISPMENYFSNNEILYMLENTLE